MSPYGHCSNKEPLSLSVFSALQEVSTRVVTTRQESFACCKSFGSDWTRVTVNPFVAPTCAIGMRKPLLEKEAVASARVVGTPKRKQTNESVPCRASDAALPVFRSLFQSCILRAAEPL